MLLRFVAENIYSFREAMEFNTLPSSKSHNHLNHKYLCFHATALRLSALYGANGAGKSNLIKAIRYLRGAVVKGSLNDFQQPDDVAFRFDPSYADKPSGLAVEFFQNRRLYYYQIEFKNNVVEFEELLLSDTDKDCFLFQRKQNDVKLNADYMTKGVNKEFLDALNRLVRSDMLFISFISKNYPSEMPLTTDAYSWFKDKLQIVLPGHVTSLVPHLFDTQESFRTMVNEIIPELKTGISALEVEKHEVTADSAKDDPVLLGAIMRARRQKGIPQMIYSRGLMEQSNVVYDGETVWLKTLVGVHEDSSGNKYNSPLSIESDGTRRLIEYMPLFYAVTQKDSVYVVDEIERSIHPILIKTIIRKISESEKATGQLIFTTHESALLDQDIFRPDEIWFAQKDSYQATQLYPLSDYNIHHTANIENGYLAGRYGGIPFLSNLDDLHW